LEIVNALAVVNSALPHEYDTGKADSGCLPARRDLEEIQIRRNHDTAEFRGAIENLIVTGLVTAVVLSPDRLQPDPRYSIE
jgi:hypothetical protein